jgi:hypothetical protein
VPFHQSAPSAVGIPANWSCWQSSVLPVASGISLCHVVRTLADPTDVELESASKKRSRIVRIALMVLTLAVIVLCIALWLSFRRWSIRVDGQTIDCGWPLMGRYGSSYPDPGAPGFYACWLQAPGRRHLAQAAWSVSGVLFALTGVGWFLARRVHNPNLYA